MDAGLIVAIVVGVIVLVALVAWAIPRGRRAREERQLEERRGKVVDRHRAVAEDRNSRATLAEKEAQRQRAEAELHEARADVHERGLADDELRSADNPDDVVRRRETFADRDRPADEPAKGEAERPTRR